MSQDKNHQKIHQSNEEESDLKQMKVSKPTNTSALNQNESSDVEDDTLENLLKSGSVATTASREIPPVNDDSDDYENESEILGKPGTNHRIPTQISSDSEDSEDNQLNQKVKEPDNTDEGEIDFQKVHAVFDKLNKQYEYGDEPIWEVAPQESDFQTNTLVKGIISDLKKKYTGKDLLAKIRGKK